MGKEQVFNGGTRAEREVAARSDAVTAAEASQAEGIVSSSMLRLQAMKRYGEFPYKGPDGRIDIRKTLEGVNPLIEAVATLANDPKTPDDVVRRVVPMVGAVELLGSTLREVHTTAQSGGFPEDAVTITARYGTVVARQWQRHGSWSMTASKPFLTGAGTTTPPSLDQHTQGADRRR